MAALLNDQTSLQPVFPAISQLSLRMLWFLRSVLLVTLHQSCSLPLGTIQYMLWVEISGNVQAVMQLMKAVNIQHYPHRLQAVFLGDLIDSISEAGEIEAVHSLVLLRRTWTGMHKHETNVTLKGWEADAFIFRVCTFDQYLKKGKQTISAQGKVQGSVAPSLNQERCEGMNGLILWSQNSVIV